MCRRAINEQIHIRKNRKFIMRVPYTQRKPICIFSCKVFSVPVARLSISIWKLFTYIRSTTSSTDNEKMNYHARSCLSCSHTHTQKQTFLSVRLFRSFDTNSWLRGIFHSSHRAKRAMCAHSAHTRMPFVFSQIASWKRPGSICVCKTTSTIAKRIDFKICFGTDDPHRVTGIPSRNDCRLWRELWWKNELENQSRNKSFKFIVDEIRGEAF